MGGPSSDQSQELCELSTVLTLANNWHQSFISQCGGLKSFIYFLGFFASFYKIYIFYTIPHFM